MYHTIYNFNLFSDSRLYIFLIIVFLLTLLLIFLKRLNRFFKVPFIKNETIRLNISRVIISFFIVIISIAFLRTMVPLCVAKIFNPIVTIEGESKEYKIDKSNNYFIESFKINDVQFEFDNRIGRLTYNGGLIAGNDEQLKITYINTGDDSFKYVTKIERKNLS